MPLPLESLPRWQRTIVAAKREAMASLAPEDQEAAREAQKAARARAAERKEAARRLARTIYGLLFDGATLEEIARTVGRSPKAVRNVCARWGLPAVTRSLARRLFVWISDDRVAALDRVARDYGATREQTLEDALVLFLDDDGHVLRRELHVKQNPSAREST